MTYKAIGFDYGGVIQGQPGPVFAAAVSKLLGVSEEEYQKAYYTYNKKLNRGEINWQQLWQLVLSELGKATLIEPVIELSNRQFDQKTNLEILELADRLRARGYKTGLLSNNTLELGQVLRSQGLDKHFDAFHISAETGLVKPEPEAFRALARELNIEVSELVFIDDSKKSLSTAEAVGFYPILFTSYETLIKTLSSLGVKTN